MTLPGDTRIAGTKTVEDWKTIRDRLMDNDNSEIWEKVFIDFFKTRLDSRYFEPIRAIEKIEQNVGEGFAIVTLHCSLIEFLAATLEGKSYKYQRNGQPPLGKYEYSNSRDMFTQFLRTRIPFCRMFSNDNEAN